jgi:hypothetical protein
MADKKYDPPSIEDRTPIVGALTAVLISTVG